MKVLSAQYNLSRVCRMPPVQNETLLDYETNIITGLMSSSLYCCSW